MQGGGEQQRIMKIVVHNAEPWYPAKFGLELAEKLRRFIRVLGVQCLSSNVSREIA
jgi:uncharacterized protein YneR